MMPSYYIVLALVRVLLPAALLTSIALRPFGLSLVYLLLFFLAPLPHVPVTQLANSFQKKFIVLTTVLSILLLLVHAAWHVMLVVSPPYGSILTNHTLIAKIGYNLGLVSFEDTHPLDCAYYLAPELVMTAASLIVCYSIQKLMNSPTPMSSDIDEKYQTFPLLVTTGKYASLLLIMVSGILKPSIISGIYYLVFMGSATAWALGQPLEKGFAVVCRCLMAIMSVHTLVLVVYQYYYFADLYPSENDFARYFGLTKIVELNELEEHTFSYSEGTEGTMWSTLASPLVILFTYYVLAIESRQLFKPKMEKKSSLSGVEVGKLNGSLLRAVSFNRTSRPTARTKWTSAVQKSRVSAMRLEAFSQEVAYSYVDTKALRGNTSETTPLIRTKSSSKRIASKASMPTLRQDSTGSVILRDDDSNMDEEKPTLLDDIIAAIIDLFEVLVRSSYIATTITMMGWSILYHSWLTFVFLMWANIVWLRQDQRSFMLKTSPILVIYAMFLLIAQYIYGMDLTESELPSNITEVNLHQIGLGRTEDEPCKPLLIKSLMTCMFWVTLRQRIQDIRQRRQSAALTDIASPLQLTVSTAASAIESKRQESRLLSKLGQFLRAACAAYWIYVVAIMLFVIGIIGERMTIFRIIYMFLFLSFILMFQISWYWWRRLMYMFWIVVIVYSMINLILIYIYQFDNFSTIIENYLLINKKLQNDLGLEPYPPADLFVKLLTPTLFLIITIMQVHYFHKDFMALSDPKTRSNSKDAESSRGGASTIKDDIPQLPLEETENHETSINGDHSMETPSFNTTKRKSSRSRSRSYGGGTTTRRSLPFNKWIGIKFVWMKRIFLVFVDKMFIYLDLHLVKIIMLSLMLLCVFNVCAMHVPIMLIICPALLFQKNRQRYYILIISTLVSIYLMAKMVYQIEYIVDSYFNVNCTSTDKNGTAINVTFSNAKWIGFEKASEYKPLVVVLKGYIGLIAMFTFFSLVRYRQETYRAKHNLTIQDTSLMFPNIAREDADKDLVNCCKYLLNYGFYKFGVEISLMCLMGVIGSRMDMYAVLYAMWLLVLVSINRAAQARLWKPFTAFIIVVVPVQYLFAVGFLPQLCIQYPWKGPDVQMRHIRNWMFLPYNEDPPHASKLIFDYILLLFATLQLRVFNIEEKHREAYAGGCNSEDNNKDWETLNFINPVPDFLGFVGTWLDVIKRMVFLGMLWVTLAIMFMTGTNRVNLFSIGYLIGSFIFLWQGTDFYLLPKTAILQWWSWLLRYNVSVVVIKTLLQIPGCIFGPTMQNNACWLVQLLGIGCVDKFTGGSIRHFIKMEYVKEAACSVPQEDIGLAWDGVCFAFLILQRRLFHSYYFYRVIDESKATTILASRGAELIEELRQKQMRAQEDQEVKILEKIKVKMERIKANQKKIQGVLSKEPVHHDAGTAGVTDTDGRRVYTKRHEARVRECPPYRTPPSHQKAVRSGDYYMFEDFDDTDLPVAEQDKSDSDDEAPKEMGLGKLLSTAFKTDLQQAVILRRASAPAVRASRFFSTSGRFSFSQEIRQRRSSRASRTSDAGDQFQPQEDTSRRESLMEDDASCVEAETWFEKIIRYLETAWAIVASFLVTLTRQLMRYSRDYRYMSRTLTLEKKVLKDKEGFGIGLREASQQRWEPLPETLTPHRKLSEISVPEIRILAPSMERGLDASPPPRRATPPNSPFDDDDTSEHESAFSLQSTESKDVTILQEQDDSMFKQDRSPFVHLVYALWYAVLAHTDIVCYIMVFINQIQSATILSIPLPLMVFLWGTLTIPRPTKTFWVTLIAYTEVIVLIKSMFQFEILPWNQKAIPANMPFTAPRIIGIERKTNYALYDLLLLLIIFLHRFMLKSLGLWKETTPEIELREDMEFTLKPEDTQKLVEGHGHDVGEKYVRLQDRTGPYDQGDGGPEGYALTKESGGEAAPGPSKPPEDGDDHFEIDDDQEPIIVVTTTMEDTYRHYPGVIWLSIKRYLRPTQHFFKQMLAPGARVTADIYAYMFLCDFINFLVVIFGFAAFGTHQGDGGVQTYLEENKVPIPFLVMLILQFALIVIDRALYLRKFMLGKILFQFSLIIGVHIWMFFVLPFITERTFNSLPPPPMWYMVKCVYLLLSAYQIRCGYPRRIIGNFLCKSYRFVNMACFRGFMAVPFVFELRTLMDWIWTDTSMTLMDWLKMEDIFANVYLLKCSRHVEDEFPQPRGMKKSPTSKYLLGGGVLAFVIAIIWFPLVFFAFGNTVGEPNPPTDVTVKIRIGPFLPVYQMSAQSHNIITFTEQDYAEMSNQYTRDRTAQTFLSNYMYNDVAVITINPNSTMKWVISPPELARLEEEAASNSSLQVKFSFVITHPSNTAQNPPTIEDSREVWLKPFEDGKRNPERDVLHDMLTNNTSPDSWLNVKLIFPKFLKVFNKGTAKPAYQLMPAASEYGPFDERSLYRNIQLRLERDKDSLYWRVREGCEKEDKLLAAIPLNNCNMLVMYTFNDKLFPETLNFISGGGIIGLYTTFVFLASRVIRGFFSGIYTKIMFDDLPNVDRVLQLCLDIYLVREAVELALEEDLFAKLVFLYRSPETMIKWSRPKEEESIEERRALPPSR